MWRISLPPAQRPAISAKSIIISAPIKNQTRHTVLYISRLSRRWFIDSHLQSSFLIFRCLWGDVLTSFKVWGPSLTKSVSMSISTAFLYLHNTISHIICLFTHTHKSNLARDHYTGITRVTPLDSDSPDRKRPAHCPPWRHGSDVFCGQSRAVKWPSVQRPPQLSCRLAGDHRSFRQVWRQHREIWTSNLMHGVHSPCRNFKESGAGPPVIFETVLHKSRHRWLAAGSSISYHHSTRPETRVVVEEGLLVYRGGGGAMGTQGGVW